MAAKNAVSISFRITDDANGFKTLTADADAFRKIMKEAVEVTNSMQSSIFKTAASVTVWRSATDAIGQLSSTLQSVTAESVSFSDAMKAANTMAGKDASGFKKLKGNVAALAKEVPIARDLLADGLYQVISNGVPEDNWIDFLKSSARSAAGGIADINKVVGVTSTIIKNYGLEWGAAADIQDKIQLTAKNGVTSFEQLAQALPRVTGNAATLGVTIDELMGTFATLTGVSGNTAEVSTQLAAIFTSLVKPSSEATDMAAQMGIQFNAAAIKAAGGFQNFLKTLDASVKSYAQTSGMLEQEIYGRLFGSAEALRALIPLQGELSEKFSSNIASMVDSAGTMDAAFEEMSGTSAAVVQKIKSHWATVTDAIASVTSGAQPLLNFLAGLGNAGASIAILVNSIKSLSSRLSLMPLFTKKARLGLEMLEAVGGKTAKAMGMLKIALKNLVSATVIGLAIWGLVEVFNYFSNSADKAAASVEKIDDCTDTYVQAAAAAKAQIDKEIQSLGELIKAEKDTREAVEHLNATYGESFGIHKTAEKWYDILTSKSQAYIKQIGLEAQAKALASKIAEAAIKKELAAQRMADLEKEGKAKMTVSKVTPGQLSLGTGSEYSEVDTKEYAQAKKDMAEAAEAEAQLQKTLDAIASVQKEVNEELSKENKQLSVNVMNWSQVSKAIEETEKALKSTTDEKKINQLKAYNAQLQARKKILESQLGLANGSSDKQMFDTSMGYENFKQLGQYEQYLNNLSKARLAAHGEELHALDMLIAKVEAAKNAFENGFRIDDGMRNFDEDGNVIDTEKLPTVELPELPDIEDLKPTVDLSNVNEAFEEMKRKAEEAAQSMEDSMLSSWNGIKGLAGGVEGITEAVTGEGSAWERLTGIVDGAIAVYQGIEAVKQAITALAPAFVAAKSAETAATMTDTNANVANAASGALSAHSWIPFVGIGLGVAAVAAMIASMMSLPKFAKGGIAYGPTLGLFGEYAGASNNPEVVAPLDKLRSLIQPAEGIGGDVRFKIEGTDLVGVLERRSKFRNRI